jgi:hypothetical protein
MSPSVPVDQGSDELDGEPLGLERRPLVFGCGAAKTGTHSIAGIFQRNYRAVHEPDADELCHLIVDLETGVATAADAVQYLREKDARYAAQIDASQLNAAIAELLVRLYPTSCFVLTVREPYSWLDSYYDHHLSQGGGANEGHAGGWKRLSEHRLRQGIHHSPHEAEIAAHGFAPIATRLAAWSARIERVTAAVPPERLLILRTDRISSKLGDLAMFAGVPLATLDTGTAWSFRTPQRFGLLTTVDRAYLDDLVQLHCQPHLGRIFGE